VARFSLLVLHTFFAEKGEIQERDRGAGFDCRHPTRYQVTGTTPLTGVGSGLTQV
jgi:hypothetical protein